MIYDHEFVAACKHLAAMQTRLNCWPRCWVGLNYITDDETGAGYEFQLWLGGSAEPEDDDVQARLQCTLDEDLLRRILRREEHWNNAELGCHITFDRKGPYMPDVHTLLCFFHC